MEVDEAWRLVADQCNLRLLEVAGGEGDPDGGDEFLLGHLPVQVAVHELANPTQLPTHLVIKTSKRF